jgi:GABA permease
MAFTTHLLVVANRTVDSPELLAALKERREHGPIHVTMLVPAAYSERAQAERRLESAIASLSADGIPAEGTIGDADPIVAVQEAWNPGRYDEVVVSTLTEGASRWLQIDLPHRVARLTDCQVKHVAVPVRRPEDELPIAPPPARRPMLESVLSLMRSGTRRSRAA